MAMWKGRIPGEQDPAARKLNSSLAVDRRLAGQDIRASAAWGRALRGAGVLTEEECEQLCSGLAQIGQELEAGRFAFRDTDEDIHTAVERRLVEMLGPLGGKIHTGRSRNDQVATDFRLWLLDHMPRLDEAFSSLQAALLERAEADRGVLFPGYTHTQRALPVLLSHWWLAHFWALLRDRKRLQQARQRTAQLPLGSAALAGTTYPIDPIALAAELGFEAPIPNSLDAVSDRDFAAEFLFCSALAGVHLSRLAEAVILFSSHEFGFFKIADPFTTGSSHMPHKQNPDIFELARGKSGSLIGLLTGLLATLKGLGSAYDRDLQEDKLPVFTAYDTLLLVLPALAGAIRSLILDPERMQASLSPELMTADLADYLVEKGVPFRQAYALVATAIRLADDRGTSISEIPLADIRAISPAFGADVAQVFDPDRSVDRRAGRGGTAPGAVAEQLEEARREWAGASGG